MVSSPREPDAGRHAPSIGAEGATHPNSTSTATEVRASDTFSPFSRGEAFSAHGVFRQYGAFPASASYSINWQHLCSFGVHRDNESNSSKRFGAGSRLPSLHMATGRNARMAIRPNAARHGRRGSAAGAEPQAGAGHSGDGGTRTMVRKTTLALAAVSALGLAGVPANVGVIATPMSEASSALLTGAVLLLIAAAARRGLVRKS